DEEQDVRRHRVRRRVKVRARTQQRDVWLGLGVFLRELDRVLDLDDGALAKPRRPETVEAVHRAGVPRADRLAHDDLPGDEFHRLMLSEDPGLAHPVVLVDGEPPPGEVDRHCPQPSHRYSTGGATACQCRQYDTRVTAARARSSSLLARATPGVCPTASSGIFPESMFPIRGVPDWNYSGNLQYVDHATAAKVHSVAFTSFAIVGNTARFFGTCTRNGAPCTFEVNVTDN